MSSLVDAVGDAAERLPGGAVEALAAALERGETLESVASTVPTGEYRAAARRLLEAWREDATASPAALALALRCARDRVEKSLDQRVSLVWTGPETTIVRARLTDQALLQVIDAARERLFVVSFAVYRVPSVAHALVAAREREVDVALILESDRIAALGRDVAASARLYEWPRERRPRVGGAPAVLHAKCAVADGRTLFVSSANLTEAAFTANIELGLLVEGGRVPALVQSHFEALLTTGELRRVPR